MTEPSLRGTWFVAPTAFDREGNLDLAGQRGLAEAVVGWGVDGITALGVMGEAAALSDEERRAVLAATLDGAAGRVPVAAGCSASSARRAGELAAAAQGLGVAAVMVSAPPLARDVDHLPLFFERVAGSVGVPLVVQDEPAATGTLLPVTALLACVRAAGARTVKLEDPPTPPKLARLLAAEPDLDVFGGLGGVHALAELRRGACGTMTGFSYPEVLAAVRERTEAGDAAGAARAYDRFLPLLAFEGQPGIGLAIRKEILVRRGVLPCAAARMVTTPDAATLAELDDVLARVGLVPSGERLEVG